MPDGVIDDRFGIKHSDFTSPEYEKLDKISPTKWEECRGLGRSFGYNRAEGEAETIAPDELIALLVDIVSKNGNLLLDVGPEADGTIPPVQMSRLQALGAWLQQNGEAIYGTKPLEAGCGRDRRRNVGLDSRKTIPRCMPRCSLNRKQPAFPSRAFLPSRLKQIYSLGDSKPFACSQQGNEDSRLFARHSSGALCLRAEAGRARVLGGTACADDSA